MGLDFRYGLLRHGLYLRTSEIILHDKWSNHVTIIDGLFNATLCGGYPDHLEVKTEDFFPSITLIIKSLIFTYNQI